MEPTDPTGTSTNSTAQATQSGNHAPHPHETQPTRLGRRSTRRGQASDAALIPVQQLLNPSPNVIDLLAGLSVEQLSNMEATLQAARRLKQPVPLTSTSIQPASRNQSSDTRAPTTAMLKFMSVIGQGPKNSLPATAPLIEHRDGIPWLTFKYSAKGINETYVIRIDVDSVNMADIPVDVQRVNCLYPMADGLEKDYKGTRRDYERECNVQGWKLVHLNMTTLSAKKGVLQRAVTSLRNASSEQKSRRFKRQEKVARVALLRKNALPARSSTTDSRGFSSQDVSQEHSVAEHRILTPKTMSWQPIIVASHEGVIQALPAQPWVDEIPVMDAALGNHHALHQQAVHLDTHPSLPQTQYTAQSSSLLLTQDLPQLGSFRDTASVTDPALYMEFGAHIQGRHETIRLYHDIAKIQVDQLTIEFRRMNCVYPRSFQEHIITPATKMAHSTQGNGSDPEGEDGEEEEEEDEDGDGESQPWNNTFGIRQGEESFLNEIGWKLCWANQELLFGRKLLLQQALDAYRRKFLPGTCQPRARIGPSLLKMSAVSMSKRGSVAGLGAIESARSPQLLDGLTQSHRSLHPYQGSHQRQSSKVRFDLADTEQASATSLTEAPGDSSKRDLGEEPYEEETYGDDDDDDEDEDDDDEDDDESGDGSSSEENSHSQMSLLTFTGKIRTYGLGTGSGSARSRPRIKPSTYSSRQPHPLTSLRSPAHSYPPVPTPTIVTHRRRSLLSEHAGLLESTRVGKKRARLEAGRTLPAEQIKQDEEQDQEATESGRAEDEKDGENEEEDSAPENYYEEDADNDWWASRLNNSEYPEDHNFVSMTTEELIGALTTGYNSDMGDEDDEEEEEDDEDEAHGAVVQRGMSYY